MTDDVLDVLRLQCDELAGMLAGLGDEGWASESRCPGWTVADVVLHLAQTNEMTVASARDELGDQRWPGLEGDVGTVDDAAGAAVAHERGSPSGEVHARWIRSVDEMIDALASRAPGDRLQWVAGDLAARTLATTRLAEQWIHTGDVAHALGVEPAADDRLWHVARLAHRTLPYAFAQAGREPAGDVAFHLTAPSGGDTWAFGADEARTVVSGPALDLCLVAGQRAHARDTALVATGPDGDDVLRLVRTFA